MPVVAVAIVGALPSAMASPSQAGIQLIAFERWVGDGSPDKEIWVMRPDGSGQRKLADGCCFAWSPDGRALAFVASDFRLSTVNVDGTGLRSLTREGVVEAPSWSPDGKQLVYGLFTREGRGLFVVPAGGGAPRRLTHALDTSPDWSPNGRKIVFERYISRPDENGNTIFVVNADGSGLRQLTPALGQRAPGWSPGGKRIAFLCWDDAAQEDGFCVMNADGSGQTLVTRSGGYEADWSPGGGRIVFVGNGGAIHTIRPDGRRHRRIVRGENRAPQWSPDGRRIVYRHRSRNHYEIYVVDASGRNIANLTNTPRPVLEDSPAWSPTRR